MIRAAIVGLGRWGRALVDSVQGRSDAIRFVAVQTRARGPAEAYCAKHGIALLADYDSVLADPRIEAVVLATPHSLHADQVIRAARAGKHVFVEKPLALCLGDAQAAADAAAHAGIVLAVGFGRRFHPSVGEIRTRLRSGALGRVLSMNAQHTTSTGQFVAADNWRADASEAPGGALTAVGVHALDLMIAFGGPVREVTCVTGRFLQGLASDDTTTALLRFESGATGTLFCSVATASDFRFSLYAAGGLAEITGLGLDQFRFVPASTVPPQGIVRPPEAETAVHAGFDSLRAQLEAFAASVRDGAPYPVPIGEVLHGMAVFDALVRSEATETPIAVAG